MRTVTAVAVATLLLASHGTGAWQSPRAVPAVESAVRAVVEAFDAPGAAVAIVQDGQVVLCKGFGVVKAGTSTKVDDRTLFYMASATKAFTVTALAILADEGKLRLDDPVVKYLPEFAVADPGLTQALTVRDLMTHRTGLPRADMLMLSGLSNPAILQRLRALGPQAPLRTRFSYQNQMYLALGLIVERLSGMPWTDFVEQRVLRPIGFLDGNAGGLGHWPADAVAAAPHWRTVSGESVLDLVPRQPSGAGGVNASARDLAAWLRFQLGDGTVGGARIVSPGVLPAEHAPTMLVPVNATMPGAVMAAYGLGWFVHEYAGQKVVQHGGNGEGWTSLVWMLPQQRFGVAVLTSQHNSALPYALAYTLADRVLGRPARDWSSEYRQLESRMGPPPLGPAASTLRVPDDAQAGDYDHPVYGRATIGRQGGRLVFSYGSLSGTLDGASITWIRSDMAAVLGPGRLSVADDAGFRLLLEAGGDRIEFIRVR